MEINPVKNMIEDVPLRARPCLGIGSFVSELSQYLSFYGQVIVVSLPLTPANATTLSDVAVSLSITRHDGHRLPVFTIH